MRKLINLWIAKRVIDSFRPRSTSSRSRDRMNWFTYGSGLGTGLLVGAGVSSVLVYLFDPADGNRRRKLLRDKAVSTTNKLGSTFDAKRENLRNIGIGMIAETRSRFEPGSTSDEKLVARIRSNIGRVISNPHAIEVAAQEGIITLRGPILQNEVDELIRTVKSVKGVRNVDNLLEVHESSEGIPALQGQR